MGAEGVQERVASGGNLLETRIRATVATTQDLEGTALRDVHLDLVDQLLEGLEGSVRQQVYQRICQLYQALQGEDPRFKMIYVLID